MSDTLIDPETCSWCTEEVEDSTLTELEDGARICAGCVEYHKMQGGGAWTPLEDEALEDYLNGEMIPLHVRETEHGVEVRSEHDFPSTWNVHRICQRCRLMPFDYEALEVPCE